MTKPTPEQIAKLPKLVQKYIEDLEWRASKAVEALAELKSGNPDSILRIHRLNDPLPNGEVLSSQYGVPGICAAIHVHLPGFDKFEIRHTYKTSNSAMWPNRSITISANHRLIFAPTASNLLEVTVDRT